MKVLLLEASPLSEKPINMHVKNSKIIQNYLKSQKDVVCDLISVASGGDAITNKIMYRVLEKEYDFVILNYSSPYLHKELCNKIKKRNKNAKYGWITSEYDLIPHTYFKYDFIIANFEEGVINKSKYDKYKMINLNTFIYNGLNKPVKKKYNTIYYSRYRPDRNVYVKKYESKDVYLSTSKKNVFKYKQNNIKNYKFIDKLNMEKGSEQLNYFNSNLYIEDEYTHNHFNNLANRFYESLQCNCVSFFDKSCLNTIKKSGYHINDYFIIDSVDELINKSKNLDGDLVKEYLVKNNDKAIYDKDLALRGFYEFLQLA
jgi:hypothetical protein